MAAHNKLEFDIKYNLNQESVNNFRQSLTQLQSLTVQDIKFNIPTDQLKNINYILQEAQSSAEELNDALQKSFNVNLGTLNISKFNQELKQLNLEDIYNKMSAIGPQGENAFRKMTSAALTTNGVFKQSDTLLTKMGETLMNTIRWSITSTVVNEFTDSIQRAYDYIKGLDKALNDIRIVTGKSADEMDRFAITANETAKDLSASTRDIAEAALIYYQQGDTAEAAQYKAQVTVTGAQVSELDADETSEYFTAIWNGYKVAEEAAREGMQVYDLYIDKAAAVAAATAADLGEIATGISKVASTAKNVGVEYDDIVAQIATMVSVTKQAPETVGVALKTIYARLGQLKLTGEDEEGVGLGQITEQLDAFGISILDTDGKMRDMSEVMAEVGEKWDDWSRKQQQAVAQLIGGTRQYSLFISLMDHWDTMYQDALNTAQSAEGTLAEQHEIYTDRIEAHIQRMRTAYEDLYSSLIDADTIKTFTDGIATIVELIDKLVDTLGGGSTVFSGLLAVLLQIGQKSLATSIGGLILSFQTANQQVKDLNNALETADEILQIPALDQTTKSVTELQKQFLTLSKVMTQAQRDQYSYLLQERQQLLDNANTWKASLNAATNYYNQIAQREGKQLTTRENIIEDPGQQHEVVKTLQDEGESLQTLNAPLKEQIEIFNQLEQAINEYNITMRQSQEGQKIFQEAISKFGLEQGEDFKEQLSKLPDKQRFMIKEMSDDLDEYGEKFEEIIEKINILSSGTEEFTTNFTKRLAKTDIQLPNIDDSQIKQWISTTDDIYDKIKSGERVETDEIIKFKNVAIGAFNEINKKQKEYLDTSENLANKNLANNFQNMKNEIDSNTKGLSDLKLQLETVFNVENVIKFTQGISNLAFALQSLIELPNIFSDEDLSVGEKLLRVITSLSFVIPNLVQAFSAFKTVSATLSTLKLGETLKTTLSQPRQETKVETNQSIQIEESKRRINQLEEEYIRLKKRSAEIEALLPELLKQRIKLNQEIKEQENEIAQYKQKIATWENKYNQESGLMRSKLQKLEDNHQKKIQESIRLAEKEKQLQNELDDIPIRTSNIDFDINQEVSNLQSLQLNVSSFSTSLKEISQEGLNASRALNIMTDGLGLLGPLLSSATKGAKGLRDALVAAFVENPVGVIVTVLTAVIGGAILAYDKLVDTLDESTEALQEATRSYEEAQSSLKEYKNELEEINKQIDELNEKGPLSLTDEGKTLEQLESEKQSVETLIKAQEKLNEAKKQELFDATNKYIEDFLPYETRDDVERQMKNLSDITAISQAKKITTESLEKGTTAIDTAALLKAQQFYKSSLLEIQQDIDDEIAKNNTQQAELYKNEYEDTKDSLDSLNASINASLSKLYEQKASLEELGKTGSDSYKVITNNIEILEDALKPLNAEQIEFYEQLKKEKSALFDNFMQQAELGTLSVESIEGYEELEETIKNAGLNVEDIVAQIYYEYNEKKSKEEAKKAEKDAKAIAEQFEKRVGMAREVLGEKLNLGSDEEPWTGVIRSSAELGTALNSLNSEFTTVQSAFEEQNELGEITYETFNDLYSLYGEDLWNALDTTGGHYRLLADELNNLAKQTKNAFEESLTFDEETQRRALRNAADLGQKSRDTIQDLGYSFDLNEGDYIQRAKNGQLRIFHKDYFKAVAKEDEYELEMAVGDWRKAQNDYKYAADALKQIESSKKAIAIATTSPPEDKGGEEFKVPIIDTNVYDWLGADIQTLLNNLEKYKKQREEVYEQYQDAIEDGNVELARSFLQQGKVLDEQMKSSYASLAAQMRNETLPNAVKELQNLVPESLISELQGLTPTAIIDKVLNDERFILKVEEDFNKQEADLSNLIQNATDDQTKAFYEAQKDSLNQRKEKFNNLVENIKTLFEQVGDAEGKGELAELYKNILDEALEAQGDFFDVLEEDFQKRLKEFTIKQEEIQFNLDMTDKNDYEKQIELSTKLYANYQDQIELTKKQIEDLNAEFAASGNQNPEKYKEQLESLNKTLRDTEKNLKGVTDQIEQYADAQIKAAKSAQDDMIKTVKEYYSNLDEQMEKEFDQRERNIDQLEKEQDKRKEMYEDAKDQLDDYLETLEKQWDMEDARNERAEKLEERRDISQQRVTQLAAAASGDLTAFNTVQDLEEQLKDIDTEIQEEMVEDIRDTIRSWFDDYQDMIDKQLDLLQKQLDKMNDQLDLDREALELQQEAREEWYKSAEFYDLIKELLTGGTVSLDGVEFDMEGLYRAVAEYSGRQYEIGYEPGLEDIWKANKEFADYLENASLIDAAATRQFSQDEEGNLVINGQTVTADSFITGISDAIQASMAITEAKREEQSTVTMKESFQEIINESIKFLTDDHNSMTKILNSLFSNQLEALSKLGNIYIGNAVNVEGNVSEENLAEVQGSVLNLYNIVTTMKSNGITGQTRRY